MKHIKPGSVVTYHNYGNECTATVESVSRCGHIIFLTTGRWIHRISVLNNKEVSQ